MIGGARQCANPISTSRQTTSNCGGKQTIAVTRVVDTFEECKGLWIRRSADSKAVSEGLDGDMSMTDDVPVL